MHATADGQACRADVATTKTYGQKARTASCDRRFSHVCSASVTTRRWPAEGVRHSHGCARCTYVVCTTRLAVSGCVHPFLGILETSWQSPVKSSLYTVEIKCVARALHVRSTWYGARVFCVVIEQVNWEVRSKHDSVRRRYSPRTDALRLPTFCNVDSTQMHPLQTLAIKPGRAQNGTQPDSPEPCPKVLSIIVIGGTSHGFGKGHRVFRTVLSPKSSFGTRPSRVQNCA
ncbi:hypothetical protein Bbelb_415280 [Branchiostoma belcheri]|nr:hypothetical protein Bbelb_415280 [Branchiostoma belcheri]